ncbi:unnamed protein product [Nesidiocoris tenuis]|uniref:Uncharacterized protein n=1 Tax=Nesidiocoris tenuis TaxID=355587 RepID=A0A6H5H712_9HEMI|nr:unnamed protein product [Nesidiocoris tenuis]
MFESCECSENFQNQVGNFPNQIESFPHQTESPQEILILIRRFLNLILKIFKPIFKILKSTCQETIKKISFHLDRDDEGVWTKSVTGNSFDTGNRIASIIFMYRLSLIANWFKLFSIPCQASSMRILVIHVFQLSQFQNLRVRLNESHLTVPRLRGSTKCRCNISIVEVCQPQTQVWPVIRGRNSLNRRAPSVIWLAFSNESNQRRQASDRIWHSSWTSFGQVKAGDRPLQNLYRKITESDDQAENRRQKITDVS